MLKDHLNNNGISSIVETKKISDYLKKNKLSYYYCYDASRKYLKEAMKEHEYKVIIDLHRDSVKHKVTTYTKDNKNYAKIMFVLATKNKNYKANEEFINNINSKLDESYKGISRGIYKRDDVIFNQDLNSKAMLIELGGVDNTIEELNNTLEVLARVLKEALDEEK
jgi:stage II sporulation protein P